MGVVSAAALLLNFNFFYLCNGVFVFESAPVAILGYHFIPVSLFVDSTGYSFGLLTSLIGACVYFYAFSYMRFERNILNFLIFLNVFKLSMILLV